MGDGARGAGVKPGTNADRRSVGERHQLSPHGGVRYGWDFGDCGIRGDGCSAVSCGGEYRSG